MLVVIAAAPISALVVERAWDKHIAGGDYTAALADNAYYFFGGAGVFCFLIPAIALIWHRTSAWPVLGWWLAGCGFLALLAACVYTATKYRGSGREWAIIAVTVVMVGVVWVLNQVLSWVLTTPVTPGLIASKLDVLFGTRGWKARVCVRGDRLAVDSMSSRWRRSRDRVTVPWHTLQSVAVEQVEQDTAWQVRVYSGSVQPRVIEYTVRQGPAVRVVGTARDLLLPVRERDAEKIVLAIETRSRDVPRYRERVTERRWEASADLRGSTARRRGSYRPWGLAFAALVCVEAFVSPVWYLVAWIFGIDTGPFVYRPRILAFLGTIAFGVGAFFVMRVLRERYVEFWLGQDYIEAFPAPTDEEVEQPWVEHSHARKQGRRRRRR